MNIRDLEPKDSEDALYAVSDLYEKASILSGMDVQNRSPQKLIIDHSIFNGYSLDSRDRCLEYLRRKPKGKWVMMTSMKIGDEIIRLTLPTDAEMPDWAKDDPPSDPPKDPDQISLF